MANLLGASGPGARVYEIASGSAPLIAPGISLRADDAKGTIEIEGDQDRIRDMKSILGLFDVKPMQLIAHICIKSKADKYESKSEVQIANTASWSFEDSLIGIKVKITPRINADGTVTGSYDISSADVRQSFVTRTAKGSPARFAFGENGLLPTPKSESKRVEAPPIEIEVQFDFVGR
jgi:type II secretory pathway component GspD/PulD (secretin)